MLRKKTYISQVFFYFFDKFKSKLIKNIRVNNNGKGVIRLVFDLKSTAFIQKNFYLKKNNTFEVNEKVLFFSFKLNNSNLKNIPFCLGRFVHPEPLLFSHRI